MSVRLKQLAQDGATDTQVVTWNNAAGKWEPADAGGGDTRIAQSGVILDGCQFFVDFNNQSSWEPNQTTTWTDTVNGAVGTAANTAITDGHLSFVPASDPSVDFGAPVAAMLNPFSGGGGIGAWVRIRTAVATGLVVNTGNGTGYDLRVMSESGGLYACRFAQQMSASNKSWTTDVVISVNEWVFLSFSWDGDVVSTTSGQMYINGVAVTTNHAGAIAGTLDNSDVVGLGQNIATGTGDMDGDIEMVMVYDAEPVGSEWLDTFNATKGRFGFSYPGTWAETLVEGQLSGGTDAVMTPGDALRGVATAVGKGGDVLIHAGDPVSGQGGDLTVRSGTSNDSAGSESKLLVFAGDSSAVSITPTFDSLTLHGTDRLVNGTAGGVVLRGGDVSGTGVGGAVAIRGGLGNTTGGELTVRSGGASAGGNITGDITISTDRDGTGDSDTNTGAIEISTTGSSTANVGGDIDIAAGSSGNVSGTRGGNISITCTDNGTAAVNASGGKILLTAADFLGTNLVANLDSGGIILQAGSNVRTAAGAGTDAEGGPIRLLAGDSALPELQGAGGLIDIIAGDNSSTSVDARGGPVTIASGSTLVGSPGIAGAITITPGTNSDGTPGDLTFNYAHFPKTDGAAGQVLTAAGSGTPGSPSQMTWSAAGASRIAQDGVITEALQFFIDLNNQSSWTPNQATTWTDTIADVAGTNTGAALLVGHLNFDGGTDEVDFGVLTAALENNFAGGGTFIAWVRVESDGGGGFGRLADTSQSGGGSEGWFCATREELSSEVRIGFGVVASAGLNEWETDARFPINTWMMVSVTYSSSTITTAPIIYVDDAVAANSAIGTPGGTVDDSGNDLMIGNRSDGTRGFDGDIEIVGLYDSALTATEIADIYNATKSRFGATAASTWAATLAAGQLSGGTDAVMTSGDELRGEDVTTGDGLELTIRGGNTSENNFVNGGAVTITGGTITGGGSAGQGGPVTIRSGESNRNIAGAEPNILIQAGDYAINSGSSPARADSVEIHGADGTTSGTAAGGVLIEGGSVSGGTAAGGPITIRAGLSGGIAGGDLNLFSGEAGTTGEFSGNITISTLNSQSTQSQTGDITITTNDNGSVARKGGDITIIAGGSKATSANQPGQITITAGSQTGSRQNGITNGFIRLNAGDAKGNNESVGGDITLTAGAQTETSLTTGVADAAGGPIRLLAGDSSLPASYGPGGFIELTAGNNTTSEGTSGAVAGGPVNITAGNALATILGTGAAGGDVTVTSGSTPSVKGTPGDITLALGVDSDGTPGNLILSYAQIPKTDGTAGQVLTTAGSGTPGAPSQMTWTTPATGSTLTYTTGAAKAGAYAAVAFDHVRVTTGATITMVATPPTDTEIGTIDASAALTAGSYTVTPGGGDLILDPATNTYIAVATCSLSFSNYIWKYDATNTRWRLL